MTLIPNTDLLNHKAQKHLPATLQERHANTILRHKRAGRLASLWRLLSSLVRPVLATVSAITTGRAASLR